MSGKRNRAEAILKSEEPWRIVFEEAAIGIALVDAEGRPVQSNPALQRMLGYTGEELSRMSFVDFTHPDDIARDRELFLEVLERKRDNYRIEKRFVRKDGGIVWGNQFGSAARDPEGKLLFAIGMVEDITERREVEQQLRTTTAQLRALTVSLRKAREEEGIRIGREIHDELGSALTSVKWDLEDIDRKISKERPSSLVLREKIWIMLHVIESTLNSVRRISAELRPSVLDDLGLAAAIEWQAQQFQFRTGIECRCDIVVEAVDFSQERSTAIFRIFQEALTNVQRHARATRVEARLEQASNALVLTVRDNGRGITESERSAPQSLGLLGMRERAELIGASIDVAGVEGEGTWVTLRIPNSGSQDDDENPDR